MENRASQRAEDQMTIKQVTTGISSSPDNFLMEGQEGE